MCSFLYIASPARLPLVRAEDNEIGFVVKVVEEWPELRARFRLPHVYSAGAGECGCSSAFFYLADDPFNAKPAVMACRARLGAYLAYAAALGPVQVFCGSSDEVMWYPLRGTMWATPQDFASDAFGGDWPPSRTLIEIMTGSPKA